MAPQKFASVRQRTSPRARLAPFRDDTSLVALRYEQTKQAEPPIPIPPPRNPQRPALYRPASTFSTSTSTPTSPTTINFSSLPLPPPPPQEQHPLFRKQPLPRSESEEWKRDSVLAPTSSSVTLRDEFAEDPIRQKLQDIIDEVPTTTAPTPPDHPFTPPPLSVSIPTRRRSAISTPDNVLVSPVSPKSPKPQPLPSSIAATPTRQPSLKEKLFGVRSSGGGSKKLKRKIMLGDNNKDADSANKSLKSPKISKSKSSPQQSPTSASANSSTGAAAAAPEGVTASFPTRSDFTPITTTIPDDSLWDDLGNLSFSKRGSIMFGGKNDPFSMMKASTITPSDSQTAATRTATSALATATAAAAPDSDQPATAQSALPLDNHLRPSTRTNDIATPELADVGNNTSTGKTGGVTAEKAARSPSHGATPSVPSIRVLPVDVERESQKVRSLYESSGEGLNWEDGGHQHHLHHHGGGVSSLPERLSREPTVLEMPIEEEENVAVYGFPCALQKISRRCVPKLLTFSSGV